jgi:iron(III) transport system substrate-binding protein
MKSAARIGWSAVGAVVALLLGPTIAAAQREPVDLKSAGGIDQLIAKAKSEGALLLYGAPSQDKMEEWFKGFQQKYGIPVQYYRAPSNPLYQRFAREQQAGRTLADGLLLSEPRLIVDADGKGWLARYTPQTADKFPKDGVMPAIAYPLFVTLAGVGWNTRVVPADLQQKLIAQPLEALLDPRLKSKVALVSVTAGGPQIASNANIVYRQGDKYGWKYFEDLAKQDPGVLNSTTNAIDAVIAGDYWATLDGYPTVFAPKITDGAPLAFRSPDVSSAAEFYLSLAARAPHPYAARLFEEWAMSLEAQSTLSVITQGDVLIDGWVDQREIRKQPWYRPPKELWLGWSTDPRLEGEQLKQFYARWQGIFGRGRGRN